MPSSLLFALALFAAQIAWAQDTPPLADPIKVPTGQLKWTMTVKRDAKSPATAFDPVISESFARDGTWTHATVELFQIGTSELWLKKNLVLTNSKITGLTARELGAGSGVPYPYFTNGFYGINNVQSADEKPPATYEGVRCRYFHGNSYEAWFDGKTGLPKAYRDGDHTFLFEFSPMTETLTVPPEMQQVMAKYGYK